MGVKQVNNSETSLKINSGFKSIKFGLVSLLTIATLIGATSVNASSRRNRRQGKTTLNQNNTRINAGMTSGYSNKFFTNTLITFMEQRQIDVDTVINAGTTTGIALLKADVVGNKPPYKLCFPCSSIVMKGNVEEELSESVINKINKKYKIIEINKFLLPKENSNRSLVVIKNK